MRRMALAMFLATAVGAGAATTITRGADGAETEIDILSKAAKADPKDPLAALNHGRALRKSGRDALAVQELTRGVLLPSARTRKLLKPLIHELALTRMEQNNLTAALDACSKLGDLPEGKALAGACRAQIHLLRNRASEALPQVDAALKLEPELYEALVVKGRILAFQQSIAEAEKMLKAAISKDPQRPEAHHQLGRIMINSNRPAAAVPHLQKARQLDASDAWILLDLGEALGVSKAAQDAFASAARLRPGMAMAHAGLARVAAQRGEIAVAEKAANEALRLDGTLYEAHVALGQVRNAQSKWAQALQSGLDAQKLVPNKSGAELVIADAHAGAGDIDLAVEAYQRAFGLDRTQPDALIRASKACRAAGRMTTAKGFADRLVLDFPKSGPAWAEMGQVLRRQGEKKRANDAFGKALTLGGVNSSEVRSLIQK